MKWDIQISNKQEYPLLCWIVAIVPKVPNTRPIQRIRIAINHLPQLPLPDCFKYDMYIREGRSIIIVDEPIAPVIPKTVPKSLKTIAITVSKVTITSVIQAIIQYSIYQYNLP